MERDEKVSRTTIFHELLRPDAAEGYAVPNVDELSSEAQNILGAASDTTGNVSIAYKSDAELTTMMPANRLYEMLTFMV